MRTVLSDPGDPSVCTQSWLEPPANYSSRCVTGITDLSFMVSEPSQRE